MEKIHSITIYSSPFIENGIVDYSYCLNNDDDNYCHFEWHDSLEKRLKDEKSYHLITGGGNGYVNGFRLVRNAYGQFLYRKQGKGYGSDKQLPYIFDIATDFNEYGLAMVAANCQFAWINKDFKYIDKSGNLRDYNQKIENGWSEIYDFSQSPNPLSKLVFYEKGSICYKVSYMNTKMELVDFRNFNGNRVFGKNSALNTFKESSTEFNKDGFAKASDSMILSDKGFYVNYDYIIDKALESGLVKDICDEAKVYKKN
jgi:hypothetical protein